MTHPQDDYRDETTGLLLLGDTIQHSLIDGNLDARSLAQVVTTFQRKQRHPVLARHQAAARINISRFCAIAREANQGEAYAGYQDRTSNCGHADVSLRINPFAAEIHDEYRCIWTCDECYDDLAGDI